MENLSLPILGALLFRQLGHVLCLRSRLAASDRIDPLFHRLRSAVDLTRSDDSAIRPLQNEIRVSVYRGLPLISIAMGRVCLNRLDPLFGVRFRGEHLATKYDLPVTGF